MSSAHASLTVGIVGATGYAGEILVGLLARHPHAHLTTVASRQHAGARIIDVLPRLRGLDPALTFAPSDPAALAASDTEVFFLGLPHGAAAPYAEALLDAGKRVIDLSADFRIRSPERYATFYGADHPAPDRLPEARYVLPELAPADAFQSALIACPGCYPTSIQLPLVPLLRTGLLTGEDLVITAVSGVSGAGKKATEFYSFTERAESVVAYGAPRHRHLAEIEQQLGEAAGRDVVVSFTPHLVPMRRGIATTILAPAGKATVADVEAAWTEAYADAPFIDRLPSGTFPDTAHVTGTNRAAFSVVHDDRTGRLVITSAIDNLTRGAASQAVQILNRAAGWSETTGLA